MKRMLITLALGFLGLCAATTAQAAAGSAFGALATADPVGQGKAELGFGLGLADATSFIGSLNYGMSEDINGRLKLALYDGDGDDTEFVLGADVQWQFLSTDQGRRRPFDLAGGGLFEYLSSDGVSILQLGAFVTGSHVFRLQSGTSLTPYARLNARMESFSWDLPPTANGDDSESNLEVGLNGGVKWRLTETVSLFGEFQLDGNDGVFFGLNLGVI